MHDPAQPSLTHASTRLACTKNPIPACTHIHGGLYGDGCDKPQFEPPLGCNETCWGFQPCEAADNPPLDCSKFPNWKTKEIPNIVDRVRLPTAIKPGEWVIQWRWDAEQTPQVWNGCADVSVVVE